MLITLGIYSQFARGKVIAVKIQVIKGLEAHALKNLDFVLEMIWNMERHLTGQWHHQMCFLEK